MDCYFHANVPSIAACTDCRKPVCATCRDSAGYCPSCRLAAKIDAASGPRQSLGGRVGARGTSAPPSPPPSQPAATIRSACVAVSDPPESRALVALGYPLFPLALLALFDRKQSKRLRRQAYQALGFNLGIAGLWGVLELTVSIPLPTIAISSGVMLAVLVPVFLVASVFYAIRTWQGEDVRVPILTDWIEEKLPANV